MGKISLFIPVNWGILFTIIGCIAAMNFIPEYGVYSFFSLPVVIFLLLKQVHPNSTAATHAEDAVLFDMPTSGGEGKSVAVIGGGISGLSAAKYLVQAGCDVTLLEQRDIVGGNNDPYLENGEHHATTVIITLPAQQPHYLHLCREYGIEQTPHEFEELKGSIVFEDRELNTKMGSGIGSFLRFIYREATLNLLLDG